MDESVSLDLVRAAMAHRGVAHELLAELGLHPGQEFLLRHLLDEDGRTPGELAELLGVEPPTVSKMVRRLDDAGFLAREPDPTDGRRTRVVLTAEGRALAGPLDDAWDRLEARTTARLDPDEVERLRDLLRRVRDGLTESR